MRAWRGPGAEIKTAAQLAAMREAGQVVERALRAAVAAAAPGAATADLEQAAARQIHAAGAAPSFLGYHGYPAVICVGVNDEVVRGVPRRDRRIRAGDIVSIDCGASVEGWHADAAVTVGVGEISDEAARLIGACERALWCGVRAVRPGARVSDVSHAVETCARRAGDYGIVQDYVGHGIGSALHMPPSLPNVGRAGRGQALSEGMALAVEPLLVLGDPGTRLLGDGWTVVTEDGGWAAHFEHTVAVTEGGPWVLTAADGGKAGLARLARAAESGRIS